MQEDKDKLHQLLKDTGFYMVYNAFDSLNLKLIDKEILSIIYSYCLADDEFKGSVEFLRSKTNTVKVTVLKSLKNLENMSLIIKNKSKGRITSKYKINYKVLHHLLENQHCNSTENVQLNNANSTKNEQLLYSTFSVQ